MYDAYKSKDGIVSKNQVPLFKIFAAKDAVDGFCQTLLFVSTIYTGTDPFKCVSFSGINLRNYLNSDSEHCFYFFEWLTD